MLLGTLLGLASLVLPLSSMTQQLLHQLENALNTSQHNPAPVYYEITSLK